MGDWNNHNYPQDNIQSGHLSVEFIQSVSAKCVNSLILPKTVQIDNLTIL